ncbi:PQQ-binding-like beta-propeller repeat protein [Paenibacillus motobuensis]|uniref:outer membrane protein assembly factor BamB family protein n=1 Tax=Paenibacillus motobuensis TaxID=295324 RepID=UPI0031D50FAD
MVKGKLNKNFKDQLLRYFIASIAVVVFTVQGVVLFLPTRASAETADVSVQNWYSYPHITVPELKPVWTLQVDNYLNMNEPYIGKQAIAEEGKVFTFAETKLVAIDAKTGKRLWAYGKDLTPFVIYSKGVIYGLSGDHKPYALNAKTGKVKWRSDSSTWIDTRMRTESLIPTEDTLYVIKGSTTFAFDMATGKLKWKVDEPLAEGNGTAYLEESDGVVLRTFYVQGALSTIQLNAYDKKTGKKIWSQLGQGEALQIKDGLVYSVDYYSPLLFEYQSQPDRKLSLNIFNLKTGAKKGNREYNWKMPGDPPYEYGQMGVFMSGDKLYIDQGDKVAQYDFDQYKTGAAPLKTFQHPYGDDWMLLNITQERLIFQDKVTWELKGIKLANGQEVVWSGDAPFSQIDVYGKGMYRAQRNGTLLAINMVTTTPVFRVKTGVDYHEKTLKTDGMLIIQAEGKLLGVKLPASL